MKIVYRADDGSVVELALPELGQVKGGFGQSGCGKTTWLKRCAGLCDTDKVTLYKGTQIVPHDNYENPFVYQSQHVTLIPHFTVARNLQLVSPDLLLTSSKALEIIALCGIEELLQRHVLQLSGGEQQRVMLARTLLCGKLNLLLDEPFSALDHSGKIHLLQHLLQYVERNKMSVFWVSHDLVELCQFTQQIIVFDNFSPKYYMSPSQHTYQLQEKHQSVPFNYVKNTQRFISADALQLSLNPGPLTEKVQVIGKISTKEYIDLIATQTHQQWCIRIYLTNWEVRYHLPKKTLENLPELNPVDLSERVSNGTVQAKFYAYLYLP